MGRNKVKSKEIETLIREQPYNRRTSVPFEYAECALICAIFYWVGKAFISANFDRFRLTTNELSGFERRGCVPYPKAIALAEWLDIPVGALNYKGYASAGGTESFEDCAWEALDNVGVGDELQHWVDWVMFKRRRWS